MAAVIASNRDWPAFQFARCWLDTPTARASHGSMPRRWDRKSLVSMRNCSSGVASSGRGSASNKVGEDCNVVGARIKPGRFNTRALLF